MGTITSGQKSKSKKIPTISETDDNTPTRVIDFSTGKPLIQITIPQIITAIIFIFGIAWFFASQWIFETKSEKLKGDMNSGFNDFRQEIFNSNNGQDLKINENKNKIDNIESLLKDLKQRNSYLK